MADPVETPVEALAPHPKNSRTHSPEQVTALGRAIREWGFLQPIVADEHGVVLIGHGRLQAAKSIGLKTVPVITRAGLSDERKRALLIADNRLAEVGSKWDEGVLGEELRYLLESDFDLTLTAFELPETREADGEGQAPAETPPLTSQHGDVWRLGKSVLGCGAHAAVGPAVFAAVEVPEVALVTEVPLGEAVGDVLAAFKAPGAVYLWHNPIDTPRLLGEAQAAGVEVRAQIIARRGTPGRSSGKAEYRRGYDIAWYGVRKGKSGQWRGGRKQSTVWETEHEGRLPVACWRRPALNHLPVDGAIFDPFVGRGTALIAMHQVARPCLGIVRERAECDAAIVRWQNFTGMEAVLDGDGRTFAAVGKSRHGGGSTGPGTNDGAGAAGADPA